jgi:divalent metal cation (Fe/Co/Zn/Cd) transporter
MPDESTRTVLVATGADLGIALAKVFAAVFTGSSAVAAAAADSLADTANDVFLLLAQRRCRGPYGMRQLIAPTAPGHVPAAVSATSP